jgi:hypothetical protein
VVEIKNKLALMDATVAANSRAESMKREEAFKEIFEQPPAFTPAQLISMVFDRAAQLTPSEHELIQRQAKIFERWDQSLLAEIAAGAVMESLTLRSVFANFLHAMYHRDRDVGQRDEALMKWTAASDRLSRINSELAHSFEDQLRTLAQSAKARGRKAADARHNAQGGSRNRQQAMQAAWASGKYTSRDRCAEEECGALNMSFATARKALRNTPDPT